MYDNIDDIRCERESIHVSHNERQKLKAMAKKLGRQRGQLLREILVTFADEVLDEEDRNTRKKAV